MENKNFKFNVAPTMTTPVEAKPDTRSYVDRMFSDFDPASGKTTTLPIQKQDGSKLGKISDAVITPDSIPVIINIGKDVEKYVGLNGLQQGETVLVIGGIRQGKSGQGRLSIPLSEVDYFCDNLRAVADAVRADIKNVKV